LVAERQAADRRSVAVTSLAGTDTARALRQDADLTGLPQAWNAGDRDAFAALTALVHQELKEIARQNRFT
jgi:hypothetical protein